MVDIDFQSVNCYGEGLCGDSFLREDVDGRTVFVHSDGLGHGSKANTLSELTCEIVLSEYYGKKSLTSLVRALVSRLPLCSVRGIGYSTFTVVDIHHTNNKVTIVEYDNPPTLLFRGFEPLVADWDSISVDCGGQSRELLVTELFLKPGDTIVVCSDGVTQSGLGLDGMPQGWGSGSLARFVEGILHSRGFGVLTSAELSARVVSRAVDNERNYPRDDISCVTLRVVDTN